MCYDNKKWECKVFSMKQTNRNQPYFIIAMGLRTVALLCVTGPIMQTFLASIGFSSQWIYIHTSIVQIVNVLTISLRLLLHKIHLPCQREAPAAAGLFIDIAFLSHRHSTWFYVSKSNKKGAYSPFFIQCPQESTNSRLS